MAKQDSLTVKLIKILPKKLQLVFIGIGYLQRREIYKANIKGMTPILNHKEEFSTDLQNYLLKNNLRNTKSVFFNMGQNKLHALYHPTKNGKIICAFHGIKGNWFDNPEEDDEDQNYDRFYRIKILQEFVAQGFGFYAFTMPGFDPSSGIRSEENFIKAAKIYADYIIDLAKIEKNNLIIWGESLGSAHATIFANILAQKNYSPSILSLITPFDSMINMVRNKFPYFTEDQLATTLSETLDTKSRMAGLKKQDTYIHMAIAKNDNIIPNQNSLNLLAKASELQFNILYQAVEGRHTTWNANEIVSALEILSTAREKNIAIDQKDSIMTIKEKLK